MRRAFLAVLLVLSAAPAFAAVKLPVAMLGVWAPEPKDCEDDPVWIKDSRVEIVPDGMVTIVDAWTVKVWRRKGEIYSGRAVVADEGGEPPVRGRLALQLLGDGRLVVTRDGYVNDPMVKCPPGIRVQ
jgi:hypothetical protein